MNADEALLPHDIVRGLRFGDRYLCFEPDELQAAMQQIVPVGEPLRSNAFPLEFVCNKPTSGFVCDSFEIVGNPMFATVFM